MMKIRYGLFLDKLRYFLQSLVWEAV